MNPLAAIATAITVVTMTTLAIFKPAILGWLLIGAFSLATIVALVASLYCMFDDILGE